MRARMRRHDACHGGRRPPALLGAGAGGRPLHLLFAAPTCLQSNSCGYSKQQSASAYAQAAGFHESLGACLWLLRMCRRDAQRSGWVLQVGAAQHAGHAPLAHLPCPALPPSLYQSISAGTMKSLGTAVSGSSCCAACYGCAFLACPPSPQPQCRGAPRIRRSPPSS